MTSLYLDYPCKDTIYKYGNILEVLELHHGTSGGHTVQSITIHFLLLALVRLYYIY